MTYDLLERVVTQAAVLSEDSKLYAAWCVENRIPCSMAIAANRFVCTFKHLLRSLDIKGKAR